MSVLTGTLGAVATYQNTAVTADVEPAVAANANLRLMGWSVRESAGSPAVATLAIKDGATVEGGNNVAHVELAANGSETKWLGPNGVLCSSGISLDVNAGTIDVVIYYTLAG